MKDQRPQYPASLFWTGVALSILRSFLWLVISTILLLIGRTTPWCGMAGLAVFFAVIAVAIGKQLIYRHATLHAEEEDWKAAMLSPEWKANVQAMVERAMNDDIELSDDFDDLDEDLDENLHDHEGEDTDEDEDEKRNTP